MNKQEDKVLAQLDLWRKQRKQKATKVVRKKTRNYPEFNLQKQIAEYCDCTFIAEQAFWQATENSAGGGEAGRWRQVKLKLLGAKDGFPDGIIISDVVDVYVEIKGPDGVVSDDQKNMHMRLRGMGKKVEVVWSYEEFLAVVKKYKIPTRDISCQQ